MYFHCKLGKTSPIYLYRIYTIHPEYTLTKTSVIGIGIMFIFVIRGAFNLEPSVGQSTVYDCSDIGLGVTTLNSYSLSINYITTVM